MCACREVCVCVCVEEYVYSVVCVQWCVYVQWCVNFRGVYVCLFVYLKRSLCVYSNVCVQCVYSGVYVEWCVHFRGVWV